jgi:hypothetical protein
LIPNSGDTLTGIVTISWSTAIDSWGHDVVYSLSYFKGTGSTSSNWVEIVNGLTDTSWDWDTTALENGEYSLRLEISSDGLVHDVILDGLVAVDNQVETTTFGKDDSGSSFIPFNTIPIAILGLMMSVIIVRKRSIHSK